MARLVAVCASKVRQEPKVELPEGTCVEGKGLEGDSHFGIPGRPLSLLRREDVEQVEVLAGFPFPPGSLAENLVVEGLPDLAVGDLLEIGGALLRVAEKGKRPEEPHSYDYRGWCLLPTVGFFLEVERGGVLRPGDEVTLKR
ncbi:MOSC domain containing protein [Aminomonas paucivorans DSM 12260]|uniref:MOSC domain containing protein n=1 Tax=Aminomonas paucivorans DSM 12260 TaxID=584708 RepID=E3CYH0_9BACT|nr:MOSC domain-containing protein [Aminomonas paucivorans]EFQ24552.1 MOSC domain containing protein [Aminomonas paucivorans DSM 12260]